LRSAIFLEWKVVDLFRERKWDLVGRRGLWFAIMAASIAICVGALFFRWQTKGMPLNYGIDFTGGGLLSYSIKPAIAPGEEISDIEKIRNLVENAGVRAQVQLASSSALLKGRDQIVIRTQLPKEGDASAELARQDGRILDLLQGSFSSSRVINSISRDIVTPVVSSELTRNAIWAALLGCIAIIFWIFIRYDFATSLVPKYALCAIFALIHDLIILVGAFAIGWWIVDSPFVAAFLTVLGFSVHDTIIIFDRIRENVKLRKRPTFAETVNISLLETLARSVNTVLTVELVLVSLYFLGGATLRGFAGALIIGITSGAWSSIFIASQLLVSWKKREEKGKVSAASAKKAAPRPSATVAKKTAAPAASGEKGAVGDDFDETQQAGGSQTGGEKSKKLKGKKRRRRY
jgi:preprotein translocase subunit SecF